MDRRQGSVPVPNFAAGGWWGDGAFRRTMKLERR
jgi:hypothetical protein